MHKNPTPLTPALCRRIVVLQAAMNATVNPEWSRDGYNFPRAINLEAAEAMEHLPWKWWKTAFPVTGKVLSRVQVELIDILHFGISTLLLERGFDDTNRPAANPHVLPTHPDIALDRVAHSMYDALVAHDDNMQRRSTRETALAASTRHLLECLETIQGTALSQKSFHWKEFTDAAAAMCLTSTNIIGLYIGKNALNLFRQEHGYKTGTYVKAWGGTEDTTDPHYMEDNDVMYDIAMWPAAPLDIEGFKTELSHYYPPFKPKKAATDRVTPADAADE